MEYFAVFWTNWFVRYTQQIICIREFIRKITLIWKYTLDKRADKEVPPLARDPSDPRRGHPMEMGWCHVVTLHAGSDTSPCSPPVTFLTSRCFAQGAVTHLLWTRTTEHNDLIRAAVPSRGRKARSPIPRFSKSHFSEKYAVIISVRERTVWHCPSLPKDMNSGCETISLTQTQKGLSCSEGSWILNGIYCKLTERSAPFPCYYSALNQALVNQYTTLFYVYVCVCVYDFTYLKTLVFFTCVIAALDTYFMVNEIQIFLKLD